MSHGRCGGSVVCCACVVLLRDCHLLQFLPRRVSLSMGVLTLPTQEAEPKQGVVLFNQFSVYSWAWAESLRFALSSLGLDVAWLYGLGVAGAQIWLHFSPSLFR